jgi:hypothetical protein
MITWFEKRRGLSLLVAAVIAASMFVISSMTFDSGGVGIGYSVRPILYHVISYFFLSLFLLIAMVAGKHRRYFLLVFVITIFYGVSDEVHQLFVPGREGSVRDVLIDGVGILFASMYYMIRLEMRGDQKPLKPKASLD